jgi:hypothetical protein
MTKVLANITIVSIPKFIVIINKLHAFSNKSLHQTKPSTCTHCCCLPLFLMHCSRYIYAHQQRIIRYPNWLCNVIGIHRKCPRNGGVHMSHPEIPISICEPFLSINLNFQKDFIWLRIKWFILFINEFKESKYLLGVQIFFQKIHSFGLWKISNKKYSI